MTKATVNALNASVAFTSLTDAARLEGIASGNHDKSQAAVAARFKEVCKAKPSAATFAKARRAYIVGRMVAYHLNAGSNSDVMVLTAESFAAYDLLITKKSKEADKSPVRLAYGSAKVLLTGLCKRAGVANPSANSGDNNGKRAPGGKPTKAAKTATKAPVAKVPTITNDNDLRSYVASQRVAMLAVMAKASQCKEILNETSSAIQDAMAILAKIAPTA